MSGFKYIIFAIFLFMGVPLCVMAALASRYAERAIFCAMIAFSSIAYFTSINFFSFEQYKGTVRGVEIIGADLFMFALIIVMLLKGRKNSWGFSLLFSGMTLYILYFLLSAVSIYYAPVKLYANAELWKMVKIFFFIVTTYNYLMRTRDFAMLVYAFSLIAIVTFCYVFY